jgi:hypothetical protein
MHSAYQPSKAQCDHGGRVRLRFDGISQRFFKRRSRVARRARRVGGSVARLAIKVLRSAIDLLDDPFSLHPGIPRDAAEAFLYLSADIFRGSADTILVHDFILCSRLPRR